MSISLQCPACGKAYQVRDDLIGRRVRCGCGAVMTVAADDGHSAGSAERAPLATPARAEHGPSPSQAAAPDGAPTTRHSRPQGRRSNAARIAAGVLSILYGAIWIVVALLTWKAGLFDTLTSLALSVAIVIGGVLILKRHPGGPACAGLACVFLCFFRAWYLLLALLSAVATAELVLALALLLVLVVVFSVPTFIVVWSLKQEKSEKTAREPSPW